MRSKATGSGFAKLGRGLLAAVGAAAVALAVAPGTALAADSVPMYRLYNQWSGEHLFTTDASEYNSLSGIGWSKEGIAWEAPSEGTTVYRLYNPYSGDHFYTSSASEYARLGSIGWNQEGTAFHSGGNKPIYRLFNRWLTAGTHLFTTDKGEYDNLTSAGWSGENVAFYGVENGGAEQKAPAQAIQVTDSGYSVDQYGYVNYAVVCKNPNTGYRVEYPKLTITGRDANGRVLFTDSTYMDDFLPGEEQHFAGQAGRSGAGPVSVEFSVTADSDYYVASTAKATEHFRASNLHEQTDEYGATTFTGEVTSLSLPSDHHNGRVSIILRDSNGRIVYGGYTYVDFGAEGVTRAFEISGYNVPAHASYEAYATPSY